MSQEVFQPLSLQVEGHLDSHRLCARGFDTAAYSHARFLMLDARGAARREAS
jgi:hypothetical protein